MGLCLFLNSCIKCIIEILDLSKTWFHRRNFLDSFSPNLVNTSLLLEALISLNFWSQNLLKKFWIKHFGFCGTRFKQEQCPLPNNWSPKSQTTWLNILYLSGLNIEQLTIGYGWRQHQEAKLKIVGGAMSPSNQQLYNICNCVS